MCATTLLKLDGERVVDAVPDIEAVEKLMGVELTPRCKYIRVIVAELARISDHLLCTGAIGLDVGAFTFFLYAFYHRCISPDRWDPP